MYLGTVIIRCMWNTAFCSGSVLRAVLFAVLFARQLLRTSLEVLLFALSSCSNNLFQSSRVYMLNYIVYQALCAVWDALILVAILPLTSIWHFSRKQICLGRGVGRPRSCNGMGPWCPFQVRVSNWWWSADTSDTFFPTSWNDIA